MELSFDEVRKKEKKEKRFWCIWGKKKKREEILGCVHNSGVTVGADWGRSGGKKVGDPSQKFEIGGRRSWSCGACSTRAGAGVAREDHAQRRLEARGSACGVLRWRFFSGDTSSGSRTSLCGYFINLRTLSCGFWIFWDFVVVFSGSWVFWWTPVLLVVT